MAPRLHNASVTPYVMTQDIEPLIAFVKRVFGGKEVLREIGGAGGTHCELRIGDTRLMFGGAVPGDPVKPRLVGLHVYVDDVDAVYQRALEAGATSLNAPADDQPYGERAGLVADPAGNHWYIGTRTGATYFAREPHTVSPHLYVRRTADRDASKLIEFLQRAFAAELESRHDEDGRMRHAVVRVYGTAIEMSEGDEARFQAPAAFLVSLKDAEAAFRAALAAGATALFPPKKQQFGGTMGGVADAWGNEWYLASPGPRRRRRAQRPARRSTRGSKAADSRPPAAGRG